MPLWDIFEALLSIFCLMRVLNDIKYTLKGQRMKFEKSQKSTFAAHPCPLTTYAHPSVQIRIYYLHTTSKNLYPDAVALHTNQTTLGSHRGTPSNMSLKRSNSSSQPLIDATNA